jgi:hypothetical protein
MFQFIEENNNLIGGFVFGGDAFDNAEISHHNKQKILYRTPGSYMANRKGFETQILTPLEELLPKSCEKTYIIGNHEDWERQFIEEHPELDGCISHVEGLALEDRGWTIVPLGHAHKINKLNVIHGEVLTGIGNQAGAFPSKKAVEMYGGSVLAGHTHSVQSFCRTSPVDHTMKHIGYIAPIGGATNPSYLRNRPTSWTNGFTIVEAHDDGKLFNVYPAIVSKGKFSFAGYEYSGNAKRG